MTLILQVIIMDRREAEEIIKEYGFVEKECGENSHKENGVIYSFPRSGQYGSIIINDVDLFVNNWKYSRIEVDDSCLVIRLYYDDHYIGCIVKVWNEIDDFEIRKGI